MNIEDNLSNESKHVSPQVFRVLPKNTECVDMVVWTDDMASVIGNTFKFTQATMESATEHEIVNMFTTSDHPLKRSLANGEWWYIMLHFRDRVRYYHETWLEPA